MRNKRLYPIVEVRWNDATSRTSWDSESAHRKWKMADCRSAGYLLKKNRSEVRVMLTYATDPDAPKEEPDGNMVKVIPRAWVQRITVLRK